MEHDTVLTDVKRVEDALEESLVALQTFCGDWPGWDDTDLELPFGEVTVGNHNA